MRQIILLLSILATSLINSQISGKLIPDGSIESSKIIGGVSVGSGNTILATNYGLIGDGRKDLLGTIASGSNILTCANGNFTNDMVGNFISVYGAVSGFTGEDVGNKALQTTIASVTNATTVVLSSNAGRSVTNSEVWTGTDNTLNFKAMFNSLNGTSYNLEFTKGIYFMSVLEELGESGLNGSYTNVVIKDSDDVHINLNGATIAAIPHSFQQSLMFNIINMHRLKISNGVFEQDRRLHNDSGNANGTGDDYNGIFQFRSLNYNTVLEQLDMRDCQGTIASMSGDLQFTNYIKGSAALGYPGLSELVYGTINDSTGIKTPDSNSLYAYTTVILDLSSAVFETTRALNPNRKGRRQYQLSGSSFAGWAGLKTARYKAFYYDDSNNFLYASGTQSFYNVYQYEDNVAKVHIQVERPVDLTKIDIQLRAPLSSIGMTLNSVRISNAAAHALSNMCSDFIMNGGSIYRIGKVEPATGSNSEDNRWATNNQIFNDVRFEDSYVAHINFVGTHNVKMTGNTLLGTSDIKLIRPTKIIPAGTSLDFSRGSMAYYNYYERTSVDLDRGAVWSNNTGNGMYLSITAGGNYVSNNHLWNSIIINQPSDEDRNKSIFRNNTIRFDMSIGVPIIHDPNNTMDIENLKLIFNDKTLVNSAITETDTFSPYIFGNDSNDLFTVYQTPTYDFGGSIKNMEVTGSNFAAASLNLSAAMMPVRNIDGLKSEVALNFRRGLPKDYEIKDLKAPWAYFNCDDFESSIISTTPIIKLINPQLRVDNLYPWDNIGCFVFGTNAKNVRFDIEGGTIELARTITTSGTNDSKLIRIENLAETNFYGTKFISVSAINVDFTNTTIATAGSGSITLYDPKTTNVTFNLREKDRIKCTTPNINCPTYASNALAVAALGVGYYYKDSADSNKFKITY